MTGFASLLGYKTGGNPLLDWIDQNRSTLLGLGAGFAGGGPDLGKAVGSSLEGAAQGQPVDYARQQQIKQQAQLAAQTNATKQYLQNTYPDLANAVDDGLPLNDAWTEAFKRQAPGYSAGGTDTPAAIQEYNLYSDQETKAGRKPLPYLEFKQASSGSDQGTTDDANAIAQAIVDGTQPPDTKGLYRLSGPIRAALAGKGFDYNKANEDWTATQKLLGSLNGAQQVRLRQAVQQTSDSLDLVGQLAQQWKGSGYPIFNKAALTAAAQGAPGFTPEQQSLATQLVAEINDVTSDLGTVYKGGNSSTDESLKLAASQLSADWSEATLRNAIALAKQNLAYRQNSLKLTPAGIDNSQYGPSGPDTMAPANVGPAGVTSAPAPAGAPKTYTYNPATGELE